MMKDKQIALELDVVKEQIAHHCAFTLGKKKIRETYPTFDKLWVDRELKRSKEAFDLVVRYGTMPFGGVRDIAQSVEDAMKGITLRPQELRQIAESIRASEAMRRYMKNSEIETPYVKELVDSLSDHQSCATEIERCINVNYEIFDQASATLKQLRKSMQACLQEITSEVQRFIAKNNAKLMDTITTIRNDRTCVLVKISEKNSVDGMLHGESASGQTAYIEPRSLVNLNNRLQSLKSREKEEIERILALLSNQVAAIGYEQLGNLDTYALLDSIFAKGSWAKQVDGCIAVVDDSDQRLYFHQARHPLIDADKVVSNTYEIKPPYHSLLITGSNTGGKTVTLKTIGLFAAMTMCGFPIAAQAGVIPFFDGIYVDIGDDQSIRESLSTFSSHISKMAYITAHAGPRSLVLLDELGSGTDPKEGEPLAVAILDALRNAHAMVIATTHYSALKSYGADHEDVLLSSVEFDMEQLRPTYHYIEGISGQSNAFEIARRYGLSEKILEKAKERKEAAKSKREETMEKLEASLMEQHEMKKQLTEKLEDVRKLQKQLYEEKAKLAQEKEAILSSIKEKAEASMEEKLEEADDIIALLKEMKAEAKPHEITELKHALHALHEEEEEVEEKKEETFALGDYVKLDKLNYYGDIVSINKEKVCVLTNGMKMNTTIHDISHAQKQVEKKKKGKGYTKSQLKSFSMEVNVIGMRVAEALPIIDKYLDNALLAKVYRVRIIHGMGTGALRKGVHDYLKHQPRVESFVMGGQGEGGLGATVVTLKQKK